MAVKNGLLIHSSMLTKNLVTSSFFGGIMTTPTIGLVHNKSVYVKNLKGIVTRYYFKNVINVGTGSIGMPSFTE